MLRYEHIHMYTHSLQYVDHYTVNKQTFTELPQEPEAISICDIYPRLFSLPPFYHVNPSFFW